jgi:hypothetical protein
MRDLEQTLVCRGTENIVNSLCRWLGLVQCKVSGICLVD